MIKSRAEVGSENSSYTYRSLGEALGFPPTGGPAHHLSARPQFPLTVSLTEASAQFLGNDHFWLVNRSQWRGSRGGRVVFLICHTILTRSFVGHKLTKYKSSSE
jgi:hypothetical protein